MQRTARKKSRKSGAAKSRKVSAKSRELYSFLFLTVFLAPAMSVAVVGGYGFAIWIYQLIAGPPGAP